MGFTKVLTEDVDLVSVGKKPLQRRRFQQAALELRPVRVTEADATPWVDTQR